MEMFNVKRRDNPSMDRWTNIKGKAFGGPTEKSDFDSSKRIMLKDYQRVIDRNSDFEGGNGKFNHNYDPTWKAITRDKVSRDAKKKSFDPMYAKHTVATVDAVEEGRIARFEQFTNENFGAFEAESEMEEPMLGMEDSEEVGAELVVDEEQLEALMEEFGDDLGDMIEDIMEKMEIEDKAEVCDLLCAAIKKMCSEEEEAEEGEE